jgi:hypothetical protein
MKRLLAGVVTAVMFSACGLPLEDENAPQADQQAINSVPVPNQGAPQLAPLPSARDRVLMRLAPRPEDRFRPYAGQ